MHLLVLEITATDDFRSRLFLVLACNACAWRFSTILRRSLLCSDDDLSQFRLLRLRNIPSRTSSAILSFVLRPMHLIAALRYFPVDSTRCQSSFSLRRALASFDLERAMSDVAALTLRVLDSVFFIVVGLLCRQLSTVVTVAISMIDGAKLTRNLKRRN